MNNQIRNTYLNEFFEWYNKIGLVDDSKLSPRVLFTQSTNIMMTVARKDGIQFAKQHWFIKDGVKKPDLLIAAHEWYHYSVQYLKDNVSLYRFNYSRLLQYMGIESDIELAADEFAIYAADREGIDTLKVLKTSIIRCYFVNIMIITVAIGILFGVAGFIFGNIFSILLGGFLIFNVVNPLLVRAQHIKSINKTIKQNSINKIRRIAESLFGENSAMFDAILKYK